MCSRVGDMGMCLPSHNFSHMLTEEWQVSWREGTDNLKGSVSGPPIALQSLFLLEVLYNTVETWPAMWTEDEVCIFSWINENKELICYCSVDKRLVCTKVNISFFPRSEYSSRTSCVLFSKGLWKNVSAVNVFDGLTATSTCAVVQECHLQCHLFKALSLFMCFRAVLSMFVIYS